MISVKLIIKLQKSNSQITIKLDFPFQTRWLIACQTLITWLWTLLVSQWKINHSVSSSEAQDSQKLLTLKQLILTLSWLINSCSSIFKFQVEESMDLEKDKENSPLFQEHGPCGPTVERLHMITELVESKHMVFIHLLLFKPRQKTSGWVFSSETQMFNHQLSQLNQMETILLPTFQPVDS